MPLLDELRQKAVRIEFFRVRKMIGITMNPIDEDNRRGAFEKRFAV
jgi:hypothetical protein